MSEKTLDLKLLRRVANQILDHLEERGLKATVLEKDYYWVVSEKERYDPYQTPKSLMLGQLYDDLERVEKLDSGEEPIAHDLVPLSSLLTYLGDNVGPI